MTSKVTRTGRTLVLDIYEVCRLLYEFSTFGESKYRNPLFPLPDLPGVTLPRFSITQSFMAVNEPPPYRPSYWTDPWAKALI